MPVAAPLKKETALVTQPVVSHRYPTNRRDKSTKQDQEINELFAGVNPTQS